MYRCVLVLIHLFVLVSSAEAAVTFDWITVGDPSNADDGTGFGSVRLTFKISKYETTNTQYAEFLNAVAATDTNGLYNSNMGSSPTNGGITQSGSSGSFTYSVKSGFASKPVQFVSFYDAIRFANWLHNGQPTGAQDASTTEDGAYTITAQGILDNSIDRNEGVAEFALASEDEWYKAAYFDGASYYDYPTGTDTQTTCAVPGATANTANCGSAVGAQSDVGGYTASASPYGTFDQGGNAYEWNESTMGGTTRGWRGGSWFNAAALMASSSRFDVAPTFEGANLGFRLVKPQITVVPAAGPGVRVLLGLLLAIVAGALLVRWAAWAEKAG